MASPQEAGWMEETFPQFHDLLQTHDADRPQDLINDFHGFDNDDGDDHDHDARRRNRSPRPHYIHSSEEEEDEEGEESTSSEEERPGPSIVNGVPVNHTGPRSLSHNQIHEVVTHCLKSSKNLLVECPELLKRRFKILTGVLDYYQWTRGASSDRDLERDKAPKPNVIYLATRNYEESKKVLKVIQEHFGSSMHLRGLRITVLDYRKNLCVNEEINHREGVQIDSACMQMRRNFQFNQHNSSRGIPVEPRPVCEFYQPCRPFENLYNLVEETGGVPMYNVHDIEDLISSGQISRQCPYFDTKQMQRHADIIICPQEFIISPLLRREFNIDLDSAIVLFDEGQEIENLCYEVGSVTVSPNDLSQFALVLREFYSACVEGRVLLPPDVASHFEQLLSSMDHLSNWIHDHVDEAPSQDQILEILSTYELGKEQIESLVDRLNDPTSTHDVEITHPESVPGLSKFLNVLALLSSHTGDYILKVTKSKMPNGRGGYWPKEVLELNLANPGVLFTTIENPALSVIVAADCLAPFSSFHTEFGVTFHETIKIDEELNLPHLFAYCQKGPSNVTYSLNYQNRNNPRVMEEVGESVLKISQKIPGGVIVVFHTETYFKKIVSRWKEGNPSIWGKLLNLKHIISEQEMTTPERMETLIARFRTLSGITATPQNGAVLLVTRRGKAYEKLGSFVGKEKRALIHVSLPYAAWYLEPLILTKRFYFETKFDCSEPQENHDWYESEAFRKLNQTFKLCLKEEEWSIVVILDNRLHSRQYEFDNLLPALVQKNLRKLSFPELMDEIEDCSFSNY